MTRILRNPTSPRINPDEFLRPLELARRKGRSRKCSRFYWTGAIFFNLAECFCPFGLNSATARTCIHTLARGRWYRVWRGATSRKYGGRSANDSLENCYSKFWKASRGSDANFDVNDGPWFARHREMVIARWPGRSVTADSFTEGWFRTITFQPPTGLYVQLRAKYSVLLVEIPWHVAICFLTFLDEYSLLHPDQTSNTETKY